MLSDVEWPVLCELATRYASMVDKRDGYLAEAQDILTASGWHEMREALEPFAAFIDAFDAKPLSGIDNDLYRIHGGTEYEGVIRLSDFRKARSAINPKGEA